MIRHIRRNVVLAAVSAFCCQMPALNAAPDVAAFFRPAANAANKLPADDIYPRGQRLMFSLYSVGSPELERQKNDGFTMIGPYYGDQEKAGVLDKAKTTGLPCFYRVGEAVDFVRNRTYTMPSDQQLTDYVTAEVKKVVDRPEIAAWYLANEELRYWRPDEMRWLQVTTDAIRKADPQHRPIMMYDPNNRDAKALEHTVRYLDYSSKGMYANISGFKHNRVWIRWGVEQEVQAIKDANPAATPVAVLWMAADPKDPTEDSLIADWTRHDVYLSLISGAKGILIWSGYNRRKGFVRTFASYYAGYAAAARELNGKQQLAAVFLFGAKRNDLKVTVTSGPATQQVNIGSAAFTYPSVSHADIAYGAARYLFLVNSANTPIEAVVTGLPATPIRMQNVLSDDAPQTMSDSFTVSLPRYGVKCFRLTPLSHE